jgi:hypothetical protein
MAQILTFLANGKRVAPLALHVSIHTTHTTCAQYLIARIARNVHDGVNRIDELFYVLFGRANPIKWLAVLVGIDLARFFYILKL